MAVEPVSDGFRTDIEGLRAMAVGAVLLFHAGFGFAGGGYVGVDVFFVISGFLITNLLLKEVERSGTVQLSRFYARRIRRLLPASVATLLFTAVLTVVVLPVNRWAAIAGDLIGSAAYLVNWRFAGRSVDYLTAESAESPVLHFWSLAVEEQFYLVWPVLMILGVSLALRAGWSRRATLGTSLAGLGLLSLFFSVYFTSANAGPAYFITPTRIWELSVGAGVALLLPVISSIPKGWASVAGWVGLGGMVSAVVQFGAETPFPSYTALLPTLGTALVIISGTIDGQTRLNRVLSIRPAQFVGKLSYSLYLFHWPIIVALEYSNGGLTPTIGTLGVLLSFVPAYLSFRFVETPFRTARRFVEPPVRGLRYGFGLTVIGALSGLSILAFIGINERSESVAVTADIAIAADASGELNTIEPLPEMKLPDGLPTRLTPSLASVSEDNADLYERGCHQNPRRAEAISCEFGPAEGPKVVLVGDSHAGQWFPAFEEIASDEGWHFYSFTKSACPFGLMLVATGGETYDSCLEWNRNVIDELLNEIRPDLVISTSSNSHLPVNADGSIPETAKRVAMYEEGLTDAVTELTTAGIQVMLLADTPRPGIDVPECLASEESVVACSVSREDASTRSLHQQVALDLELSFIDMAPFICTPSLCPAVIDGTIVWRDDSHMTATYVRYLAPALKQAVLQESEVGFVEVILPLSEMKLSDELPAGTVPPLTAVADDNPSLYDEGCHQNQSRSDPIACEYGTAGGPIVVLVGDSQAAQWVPAFEAVVAQEGWHFYSFSKSACPFGLMLMGVRGEPYDSCLEWNRNVIDLLVDEIRPDLVISTSSNTNLPMNPDGTIPDTDQRLDLYRQGLTEAVEELMAAGIKVALLADTPRPRVDIPECLASELSVTACSVARAEAHTYSLQGDVAEALGVPYADMADFICTPTVCPAVIENVIVWRDKNHMTATYAQSLAGALMQALPDV